MDVYILAIVHFWSSEAGSDIDNASGLPLGLFRGNGLPRDNCFVAVQTLQPPIVVIVSVLMAHNLDCF